MYTPLAAEIIRRENARAARTEQRPPAPPPRTRVALRRLVADALRRSADRLAPEC